MEEWKEYKLGEVCSRLKSGKGIKADSVSNTGKYPVIGGNGVRGYADEFNFQGQAAVIGRQGAYCGNVRFFEGKAYMTEHAVVAVGNEFADTRFLACLLSLMHLGNLSAQSAQPGISVQTLSKQIVRLPSISYQKKVSAIIKSLDDKIEVKRRINDNLEQQAQALFKSWCVDFEPFKNGEFVESELGMIPKGWRVYSLSEFLPVITGKKDANVAKGGPYPFFSCSQDYGWTDDYSFEGNAILVAGNGDFNVKMYNGKFEAYQRTYVLIPHNPQYTAWLFYAVKYHLNDITSAARGSVIKFITKGNLADFRFPAPSILDKTEVIERFSCIKRIVASNEQESRRLAELRDTLLPKLMSGELKVNEVY